MVQQRIRTPMAVDAEPRLPLGPIMLPFRAVISMAISAPVVVVLLSLPFISLIWRAFGAIFVIAMAGALGTPKKEGVWLGTYYIYRKARILMPTVIRNGIARRATVKLKGQGVLVADEKARLTLKGKSSKYLDYFTDVPRAEVVQPGIIRYNQSGHHAVLKILGPEQGMNYDGYTVWCEQAMTWISELKCPAQFLSLVTHFDSREAEDAFNSGLKQTGTTIDYLLDSERFLATEVASKSLGLEHYLILSPGAADTKGKPTQSFLRTASGTYNCPLKEAERMGGLAIRLAKTFNIEAFTPSDEEMQRLLERTLVGCRSAECGTDILRIDGEELSVFTVTKLAPSVVAGGIVEVLMEAQCQGIASLHYYPVDLIEARKEVSRQAQTFTYAAEKGGGDIGVDVAIAENQNVIMAIAERKLIPCRMALTIGFKHQERSVVGEATERAIGRIQGDGFSVELCSGPGFLPALALSPGGPPLGRSLQLTARDVVTRMLPALGTPFSDARAPLVGINVSTGAPAYLNVWDRPNHNLVIVGSSGAGKSVSCKTLLVRHLMRGGSAVVIDPDSEYGPIIGVLGGDYYELGEQSINPLGAGMGQTPDKAAELLLPVFSVMAGDEKAIVNGQPIRRLPDEDQGWMHAQLAEFFTERQRAAVREEPILSDFIKYLEVKGPETLFTEKGVERLRIIMARLSRYTQGERGKVFNRKSAFTIGNKTVGIGLRTMAMTYSADLTAALAMVLTQVLAGMGIYQNRIILVDEAHRVTNDPDAGAVFGQLSRQARKYKHAIWMASQQVDDFVKTDLGRTLIATAATKLIMGLEEAMLPDAIEVFKLRPEESALLNPFEKGRGVLISGDERSPVRVVTGVVIRQLADTSQSFIQAEEEAEEEAVGEPL